MQGFVIDIVCDDVNEIAVVWMRRGRQPFKLRADSTSA